MNELLESLCKAYERELESQEAILAMCESQHRAIAAHDYEYVEAKSGHAQRLTYTLKSVQRERLGLFQEVLMEYCEPGEPSTFRNALKRIPEPWLTRLARAHNRLDLIRRNTLQSVDTSVKHLQRSAGTIEQCMHSFMLCVPVDMPVDSLNAVKASREVLESVDVPMENHAAMASNDSNALG